MKYNLIIEDFGKIKNANIQMTPLTLFVGDNNAGKSYLLSLIWGLYSADDASILFRNIEELKIKEYEEIRYQLECMYRDVQKGLVVENEFRAKDMMNILNSILKNKKDIFVQNIFNYEDISIGKLEIQLEQEEQIVITANGTGDFVKFSIENNLNSIGFGREVPEHFASMILMQSILGWMLSGKMNVRNGEVIYLPAARTGFVLAKDVINKVGRKTAYDVINDGEIELSQRMQPFTKPIIQFLDALEDLSVDSKGKYEEVAEWIERAMAHGNIQYNGVSGKEIRYIPKGQKESLPLRTTSAVVTELAPLIMLLKYKREINAICYEEPEMCLHPQLQQQMGRLLIRLVNKKIAIIATTHSDIIIQHLNNVCKLKEMGTPTEVMDKLDLSEEDVIDIEDVSIYQLVDRGDYSEVEKIIPERGEFKVRTFHNALLNLLNQTSEVQEFEMEQEE